MNTPIRFLIVSSLSVFLACSCLEGYAKKEKQMLPAVDTIIYEIVDRMPTFQGREAKTFSRWASQQVQYPTDAIDRGHQGKVLVRFIIEKDGTPSEFEIFESSRRRSLDKAALDAVKQSPRWEPGIKDGKPVRVYFIVPIIFQLQ